MLRRMLVLTALATTAMAGPASSQQSPPASKQSKRIETMVNNAAALVDKEGKAALAEFRMRDSQWWFGNTYLFAYDMNLNVLLNPAFPNREGSKAHGEKDANGVMFHDEFVKVVQSRGRVGSLTFPQTRTNPTLSKMELRESHHDRR
ncbi:MAG: cache domain-containing protein, partial [Bradyrhizobium sp.]